MELLEPVFRKRKVPVGPFLRAPQHFSRLAGLVAAPASAGATAALANTRYALVGAPN